MDTCGVEDPRNPEIKCSKRPHKGEWHSVPLNDQGGMFEYRVRPPRPKRVNPPCLEDSE